MHKKTKPKRNVHPTIRPTANGSLGEESCSDESTTNNTYSPRHGVRSAGNKEHSTSKTRNTSLINEHSLRQSPRATTSKRKFNNQSEKTKAAELASAAKSKNSKYPNIQLESYPGFLIPRLPFARFVREIMYQVTSNPSIRSITPVALEALQSAAEMHLTQILQDAYYLCLHRGRVTLSPKDLVLIKYLTFN